MEDLIQVIEKLMIENWSLPEQQVRQFLKESFPTNDSGLDLDELREQTSSLLQDVVLSTLPENKAT